MKIADEIFFSWIRNSFNTSPSSHFEWSSSHFEWFPMLMHTILVFLNNCSTNFLTILIKKIRIPVKEVQLKSIQRTSGFFYLQLTYFYPGKLTGTKFDFEKFEKKSFASSHHFHQSHKGKFSSLFTTR